MSFLFPDTTCVSFRTLMTGDWGGSFRDGTSPLLKEERRRWCFSVPSGQIFRGYVCLYVRAFCRDLPFLKKIAETVKSQYNDFEGKGSPSQVSEDTLQKFVATKSQELSLFYPVESPKTNEDKVREE